MNDIYQPLPNPEEDWLLQDTNNSHSTDSAELNDTESRSTPSDIFDTLRSLRREKTERTFNSIINSIRYKFDDLQQMLIDKLTDMLIISETKFDVSFNSNLFNTNSYKMERRDRNAPGSRIMTFVRGDLPVKWRKDTESKNIECICYELNMTKRKCGILCLYRQPNMKDSEFEKHLTNCLDKMHIHFDFDNVMCIGDLNYDFR